MSQQAARADRCAAAGRCDTANDLAALEPHGVRRLVLSNDAARRVVDLGPDAGTPDGAQRLAHVIDLQLSTHLRQPHLREAAVIVGLEQLPAQDVFELHGFNTLFERLDRRGQFFCCAVAHLANSIQRRTKAIAQTISGTLSAKTAIR